MTTLTESLTPPFSFSSHPVLQSNPCPEPTSQTKNIAFIDCTISDQDTLIEGIENSEVFVIDSNENGIAAISIVLSQYQNLDSIQIFSHGNSGALALGNSNLNGDILSQYGTDLQQWGSALASTGDILLYGCNVAAGDKGTSFIDQLHELTGHDIAASSNLTGQGGDWQLEVVTGTIEANTVLGSQAQQHYAGTLAAPIITSPANTDTAVVHVSEGTMTVTDIAVTDADGDHEGNGISYSINAGNDAHLFDINPQTGQISFKATPDWEHPTDSDGNNVYELNVLVFDSTWQADSQFLSVIVDNVLGNLIPPDIISNGGGNSATLAVDEGYTFVTDINVTTGIDSDREGNGIIYSLSGKDVSKFIIDSQTGQLSFKTAPDYENPTDQNLDNVYEVKVIATDSTGKADTQNLGIVIQNVTETGLAPTITSNGGNDTAAVHVVEGTTIVTDINVTDPDGDSEGTGITYRINDGADAAKFTINANTGQLSFKTAPDYENPTDADANNVYEINILATDSAGHSDSQFLSVIVDDIAETGTAPVITSHGGGESAVISTNEGTTIVTDVNVTDPDGDIEGNGITYRINDGADAAKFTINTNTGQLSFKTAPDYENPTDADANNVYEINILATDSAGHSDNQFLSVVVTDIPEGNFAPSITSYNGQDSVIIHVAEGSSLVANVESTDLDGDTEGNGITYTLNGGDDVNLFTVDSATGQLSFKTAPDYEHPTDADGNNVYAVRVQSTDSTARTDYQFFTVIVDNVLQEGSAPVITSNGGDSSAVINIPEGTLSVANINTTDADGDTENNGMTYAINAGADANRFNINANTGELTFKTLPDYENPTDADGNNVYEVNIIATDSSGQSDSQYLSVIVGNSPEIPVITSHGGGDLATVSMVENNLAVTTVTAAGQGLIYAIRPVAGDDSAHFEINPTSGELRFKVAPDYENPTDEDGDNAYVVVVEARNAEGETDTQIITVNVTNEVSVFLLGGQSNMVGEGSQNSELPANLATPDPDVKIWQYNTQSFIPLQPGFTGWSGEANSFGPELSFGHAMKSQAKEEVYLIKYALGGTNLAVDWNPYGTNNQHDIFVSRVSTALAGLTQAGISYDIEGMLWMQGETDSLNESHAIAYEANLSAFIADMRNRYGTDLTFGLGRIHNALPWAPLGNVSIVRTAQENVAAADANAYLVNTDGFGLNADNIHFNTDGQLGLGYAFANVFTS